MSRRSFHRFFAVASMWGAVALAGCQGQTGGTTTPPAGTLTLDVVPTPTAVAGLQMSSGHLEIEGLTVLGDVAPDGRSMIAEFNLDLLSPGASFSLSMLPQGVYSRVRFNIDHASVGGTWRGMPFTVSVGSGDDGGSAAIVDLRSNGVEVTPGQDGKLTLDVDAGSWFADNVLDGATPASGQIVIDRLNNTAVGAQIISRLAGSFTLQDSSAPVP